MPHSPTDPKKEIDRVTSALRAFGEREPAIKNHAGVIIGQLKNYARANAEDRACLRPAIEEACTRLERARGGR